MGTCVHRVMNGQKCQIQHIVSKGSFSDFWRVLKNASSLSQTVWALRCGVVSNTPSSMLVKMATAYHTGTLGSPALRTNVEPNCLGIKMWCGSNTPSSMLVKMATAYHTSTLGSPALRANVELTYKSSLSRPLQCRTVAQEINVLQQSRFPLF